MRVLASKDFTVSRANYQRSRYRTDPAFRASVLASSKKYLAKTADDPICQELRYLARHIHNLRKRLTAHQEKAASFEKRLLRAIRERDGLIEKRKEAREIARMEAA